MLLDSLILVTLAVNTLLSIIVFLCNKKAVTNRLYAAFVTFLDLWIISNFLENEPGLVGIANLEFFLRLDFALAICITSSWLGFCLVFSKSRFIQSNYRWINIGLLIIGIILIPLALFGNLIVKDVSFVNNVIGFKNGFLWPLYATLLSFWSFGGLVILFLGKRKAKKEKDILKIQQINLVSAGFLISIGNAIVINLFLQSFYPISLETSRLGLYGMTFLVVFTSYAIIRHQFLDIRRIKEYSAELEQKVQERTHQIQKLQEDQKQMILDISHGLQTPLTVMRSELEFLKKQMPDNKKVVVLEKSIDRISKFIYDLLKLSRLEINYNSKKELVDLSKLLNEFTEYFEILMLDKKITFLSDIKPDITVWGQKDELNELVTNLVSNSIKYMQEKENRKIMLSLSRPNGKIELTVKDTGVGISKKDQLKVFNRFYRVRNNGQPNIDGSGLGLAICKKIAENHNGFIYVKSKIGKGTTFAVTLPSNH